MALQFAASYENFQENQQVISLLSKRQTSLCENENFVVRF